MKQVRNLQGSGPGAPRTLGVNSDTFISRINSRLQAKESDFLELPTGDVEFPRGREVGCIKPFEKGEFSDVTSQKYGRQSMDSTFNDVEYECQRSMYHALPSHVAEYMTDVYYTVKPKSSFVGILTEVGTGDFRLSAGATRIWREGAGLVAFAFDQDQSAIDPFTRKHYQRAVTKGTDMVFKLGNVFAENTRIPKSDWSIGSPEPDDDMFAWAINLTAWSWHEDGVCTLLVPAEKEDAVRSFIDRVYAEPTEIHVLDGVTFEDCRHYTASRRKFCILTWVAGQLTEEWP